MGFSPLRGLVGGGTLLVLLAVLTSGCGPGVGSVTGKVFYQGKLVKGGNVTFVSTEGRPSLSATINEDGTYSVPKISGGAVKICVDTKSLNPGMAKAMKYSPPAGMKAPEGLNAGESAEKLAKRYTPIPPKYGSPDTTTLTYTVKAGAQEHDIKMD